MSFVDASLIMKYRFLNNRRTKFLLLHFVPADRKSAAVSDVTIATSSTTSSSQARGTGSRCRTNGIDGDGDVIIWQCCTVTSRVLKRRREWQGYYRVTASARATSRAQIFRQCALDRDRPRVRVEDTDTRRWWSWWWWRGCCECASSPSWILPLEVAPEARVLRLRKIRRNRQVTCACNPLHGDCALLIICWCCCETIPYVLYHAIGESCVPLPRRQSDTTTTTTITGCSSLAQTPTTTRRLITISGTSVCRVFAFASGFRDFTNVPHGVTNNDEPFQIFRPAFRFFELSTREAPATTCCCRKTEVAWIISVPL